MQALWVNQDKWIHSYIVVLGNRRIQYSVLCGHWLIFYNDILAFQLDQFDLNERLKNEAGVRPLEENFLFIWSFKFCRLLMEFLISLQNY